MAWVTGSSEEQLMCVSRFEKHSRTQLGLAYIGGLFIDQSVQKFCDRVFNAEGNFDARHQAIQIVLVLHQLLSGTAPN